MRKIKEIADAEKELSDRVWFNRHLVLQEKVIALEETVDPEIWKGAQEAAVAMEKKYGTDALAPVDDFEWGMINGKLSALRWLQGEEWDMLDT